MLYLLYREGCVECVAGREHGVAGSLARFADDDNLRHTAELSEVLDDPFIQYAHGFGVSVVPYMEMLLRLNVEILQISRPVPNRMFYLVTDPAMTLSPAAADFKRFVLTQSEGR